ncbi:type IA DNA topoisomerase [Chryseobacterium sp. ISL-6]|uniref:type IA DNA topoisomerase n=1 Tax=Chryseobacterium sp. ISL-6 TaxID=2819143 RepID=UPI001BE7D7FB|nr:type IA DNA topoisomerase [Chryseobacterium sp. ISL-6]MBT2623601.1 topoisomerase C-terminal repeat-containing protein [Chryseobacterium sp. ISL-6]
MKVIIAEKPSAALEIASVLGPFQKKEGYLEGNTYCVTWAFEHWIDLGMPHDEDISGFETNSLPVLPEPYLRATGKIKKENSLALGIAALKQLSIIQQLFNQCEGIIVATHADRKGELIFRSVYQYLKCTKPFERLWISSLTEKSIKQGFENLKPGKDFHGLYKASQCNHYADRLIDINSTQALHTVTHKNIYLPGRVQTPVLAMVCKRYFENKGFSVQKYWQIELLHTKDFIEFKSRSQTTLNNKKQAEDLLRSIERNGNTLSVASITHKNITEHPPLLFDLTGLQKEANQKLNLSAEETLNIAQNLYEKKFITYPKTKNKYIPEDMWTEIPNLIRLLESKDHFGQIIRTMKWGHFNKHIVRHAMFTDHPGLLITEKIPSALSSEQNAVYEMIAFRLLESVSEACIRQITEVSLQALHYDFIAKGCKILNTGWRLIKGQFSDETRTIEDLPSLKEGDELKIKVTAILEEKAKPPELYTEATLLSAMETAGKRAEDDEEKKISQNIGIGTPATRAGIIETLCNLDYIKRENKSLIPTEKGLQIYELVKDKKIADAAMMAKWELTMQKIENNETDAISFQKEIEAYAASIIQELLQVKLRQMNLPPIICPKCQSHPLTILDKIIQCTGGACRWLMLRNICGISMDPNDIESLFAKGKTYLIKGMKSKSGKKFDAHLVLNEDHTISFEFENNKK